MIITRALQGMLLRQEVLEVTEGIKTEERLRKMTPSNTIQVRLARQLLIADQRLDPQQETTTSLFRAANDLPRETSDLL